MSFATCMSAITFCKQPYGAISRKLLERYSMEQIHDLCLYPYRLPAGLTKADRVFVERMVKLEQTKAASLLAKAKDVSAIIAMMDDYVSGTRIACFNNFAPLCMDHAAAHRRYLIELNRMGVLTTGGQQQCRASEQREFLEGTMLVTRQDGLSPGFLHRMFAGYSFCCVVEDSAAMIIITSSDVLETSIKRERNYIFTDHVLTMDNGRPFTHANLEIDPMNLMRFVESGRARAVVTFMAWQPDWHADESSLAKDLCDRLKLDQTWS